VPEGLSAAEVGKEISEHGKHAHDGAADRRDRMLSITEALLLSLVAVLAGLLGLRRGQVGHRVLGVAGQGVGGAHQGQPRRPRRASDSHARLGVVQRLVRGLQRQATPARNASPRSAFARATARRSTPGWPPIRRTTRRRRRGLPTCRNTSFLRKPPRTPMTHRRIPRFAKGTNAGATGDKYVRDNRLPGDGALPGRDQQPLPAAPGTLLADRGGDADPRIFDRPAARPAGAAMSRGVRLEAFF